MSQRLIAIAVALCALAVVAAGCGGDSDEETTATLTKEEFIAQGDVICKNGEDEVEAEADVYAEENGIDAERLTPEDLEGIVTAVFVPSLQKQADELRELGLPEGAEEEAEDVIDTLEEAIASLEEDPGEALGSESGPFGEAQQKAIAFGFEECGS